MNPVLKTASQLVTYIEKNIFSIFIHAFHAVSVHCLVVAHFAWAGFYTILKMSKVVRKIIRMERRFLDYQVEFTTWRFSACKGTCQWIHSVINGALFLGGKFSQQFKKCQLPTVFRTTLRFYRFCKAGDALVSFDGCFLNLRTKRDSRRTIDIQYCANMDMVLGHLWQLYTIWVFYSWVLVNHDQLDKSSYWCFLR